MVLSAVYAYPPLPSTASNASDVEALSVVAKVEDYVARMLKAALPGNYFVDFFPWMMHIPTWFPGASWKREGYAWFRRDTDMFMGLVGQTEDALVSGITAPRTHSLRDHVNVWRALTVFYQRKKEPAGSALWRNFQNALLSTTSVLWRPHGLQA